MIPGDHGISLGVLAVEPVPLTTRTLSLEPRRFRRRAVGTNPYPGIFIGAARHTIGLLCGTFTWTIPTWTPG